MTPYPCPVCKATVERGPSCRRCRADISLLDALEEGRAHVLENARRAIVEGRRQEGLTLAAQADFLRSDSASSRLVALAHLARGEFELAFRAYGRCACE